MKVLWPSLLLLILPSLVLAHGAVDQDYPVTGGGRPIQSLMPVGQMFTPSASTLSGVDIFFRGTPNLGSAPVTVNVHRREISSPVLGTATRDVPFCPDVPPRSCLVHFDFPATVSVIPGEPYIIELITNSAFHLWQEGLIPAYPGGLAIIQGKLDLLADFGFRTYDATVGLSAALTPATMDFGSDWVGVSGMRTATLKNTGDGPLAISSIEASGAVFSQSNDCPSFLNSGESCLIRVVFDPVRAGVATGMLTVAHSAPGGKSTISLQGSASGIRFNPQLFSYSGIVGLPTFGLITLTNVNRQSFNIHSVSVATPFRADSDCVGRIDPDGSCEILVTFEPVGQGTVTRILTIEHDGIPGPHQLELRGSGATSSSAIAGRFEFDPEPVGVASPSLNVDLRNTGATTVAINSISTSEGFTQSNNCGSSLAGGTSCLILVTFKPEQEGFYNGYLSVGAGGGYSLLGLTGFGLPPEVVPVLRDISPLSRAVGSGSTTLWITGDNFYSNSVARWNGVDLPTRVVAFNQMFASIPASALDTLQSAEITVFNPGAKGGISNSARFTVYGAVDLNANDLAYDPISRQIYASVGVNAPNRRNTITAIDPAKGTIQASVPIGRNPGKLAQSNNRYLYVSLDDEAAISRLDLQSRTPDQRFELGVHPSQGRYVVSDLDAMPGDASTLAVSRKYATASGDGGIAIYTNGVQRPVSTPSTSGTSVIAFPDSPDDLYGVSSSFTSPGFLRMSVTQAGVIITSIDPELSGGGDIKAEGRRVYSTGGRVIDGISGFRLGDFPVSAAASMAPDKDTGRAFFLSSPSEVSVFDQSNFKLIGGLRLPGVEPSGSPEMGSLVRWGDDGLAFRTKTKVVFFRVPPDWLAPNKRSFAIAGNSGASMETSGKTSVLSVGYARVQPYDGNNAPAGVAIYSYKPGSYLVSETGVPAVTPATAGRIYVEAGNRVNTGVAIANPNSVPATIEFNYTDSSGTDFGRGTVTIPAYGQLARFIDSPEFKTFSGFFQPGTLTYKSNVPVGAIAIRTLTNERSDFLTSTLPVVDWTAPAATGIAVVPHFADGGGWTTQLLLMNPTDNTLTGTIEFRNNDGGTQSVTVDGQTAQVFPYTLRPRSFQKLTTSGLPSSTLSGSIRVIPGSGPTPEPLALFVYKPAGVTLSEATVPGVKGTALRSYVEIKDAARGGIQSAIAITNTGSTGTTVTLELIGLDGNATGLIATHELPGFGRKSMFLNQFFGSHALPDPFQGVLRITSNSPVSVVSLRSRYNEKADFLITTTPAVNESAPSSSEVIFPQLADGGGYTTQFILFSRTSTQTTGGTLDFFDPAGRPLHLIFR